MKTLQPFSPNSLNIHLEGEIIKQGHLFLLKFSLLDPAKAVLDSLREGVWKHWERADDLWKTTCFEAFISEPEKQSYWEINLSPSKQKWNLYHFESYREPQPPKPSQDFEIVEIRAGRETLDCTLKARVEVSSEFESNLTTVIRTETGISYYALHHAPSKPDFHYRRAMLPAE